MDCKGVQFSDSDEYNETKFADDFIITGLAMQGFLAETAADASLGICGGKTGLQFLCGPNTK